MNVVSLDPYLLLQLLESVLWGFVWAVAVLFGVECICVVVLWLRDARKGCASIFLETPNDEERV